MRKLAILLLVMLSGCGNGDGNFATEPQPTSHAPQIVDLQLSPTSLSYMEGDGSVAVTAAFTFLDIGRDAQSMKVEMPDGTTMTIELPGLMNVGTGPVSQTFDVSTAALGSYILEVWLVDAAGNSSNHLSAQVLVESPVPEITILDPAEVQSGTGAFELTVTGAGFLTGAMVTWDGADRTTTFVSGTQLVASISATDIETPRTVRVRVRNPAPTPDASNELSFVVAGEPGPSPAGYPILITETTDGLPPNGPSVNGGLDWDGGSVTFASKASNLVPGDTNDAYDLFIRDTCLRYIPDDECTPSTIRPVMGIGGSEPNGDVGWTEASPEGALAVSFNGRYVAFVSSASNLVPGDTNGVADVFLLDTCIRAYPFTDCTPGVIRISVGNGGVQATAPASHPAVADDGRYVVFVSTDPNLVAGDTNGVADVFLRDTCRGAGAQCAPSTKRVSVTNVGGQANGASGEAVFTGRYVAFSSLANNLVPGDTNGLQDVFIRDTCLGEPGCVATSTRLVSVGYLGDPADGASSDPQVSWGLSDSEGHDYHGRFVAFVSSATNLVEGDSNGAADVFRRDTCTNEPGCIPSTILVSKTSSGAQVSGDSWSPNFLSWYGGSIPFVTAANGVVSGDTNGLADVYVWSGSTRRISVSADGTQTDGASYAPRMSHHFYGPWLITYISEASNILPNAVVIPNNGNIYMDLNN
ncbi:MAG TPA: hypothetical protein VIS31_04765 [Woeseiaceae bacterium]